MTGKIYWNINPLETCSVDAFLEFGRAKFERFLAIWKDADADVPELADARRRYGQSVARLAR